MNSTIEQPKKTSKKNLMETRTKKTKSSSKNMDTKTLEVTDDVMENGLPTELSTISISNDYAEILQQASTQITKKNEAKVKKDKLNEVVFNLKGDNEYQNVIDYLYSLNPDKNLKEIISVFETTLQTRVMKQAYVANLTKCGFLRKIRYGVLGYYYQLGQSDLQNEVKKIMDLIKVLCLRNMPILSKLKVTIAKKDIVLENIQEKVFHDMVMLDIKETPFSVLYLKQRNSDIVSIIEELIILWSLMFLNYQISSDIIIDQSESQENIAKKIKLQKSLQEKLLTFNTDSDPIIKKFCNILKKITSTANKTVENKQQKINQSVQNAAIKDLTLDLNDDDEDENDVEDEDENDNEMENM